MPVGPFPAIKEACLCLASGPTHVVRHSLVLTSRLGEPGFHNNSNPVHPVGPLDPSESCPFVSLAPWGRGMQEPRSTILSFLSSPKNPNSFVGPREVI